MSRCSCSFLLSVALIVFGSGPGASDAKVNLLGFQPAELIRILIVFFLAGYFADRWEFLRTLREHRPEMARVSRWVEVPRLEYLLPVLIGVAVSLAFFFLQKDLGPALLIACLFLAMYAVARDRYLFAAAGMALILAGFVGGYLLHFPRNVASRVSMWLSPWDNAVRGGDQVVHALWGMATGGLFGSGIGLGDPRRHARRPHRFDSGRARRGVGLRSESSRCSCCMQCWCGSASGRHCARSPTTASSWRSG